MRVSKKLTVLIGTGLIYVLQQKGIDTTGLLEEIQSNSSDALYYLSGVYIAVQGIIDSISKRKE